MLQKECFACRQERYVGCRECEGTCTVVPKSYGIPAEIIAETPAGQYVCPGHEAVAATQKRAQHSGTRIFTGMTKKDPHTERRKHVPVDRIPGERIPIDWVPYESISIDRIPYERSAIDRIPYNKIPVAFPSMYAETVNHAETSSQST